MVEMKVEATEPDPSAAPATDVEGPSNAQPASGATPINSLDVEARTSAAPSIEEVKEIVTDVKAEDHINGNNGNASVKTGGHTTPEAITKASEAIKNDSDVANTVSMVEKGKPEQDSNAHGANPQNSTKSADRRNGDRHLSSNKNKKQGSLHQKPWQDYSENVKSDLTSQEESSDPTAIRKQVEFYFSDSNLHMDKFLLEKVGGHKNLPVPISIIHSFKRMRHFQPYAAIVTALKQSTVLDVVENDSCLQRKIPMPKDLVDKPLREVQKVYEDRAMAQSIYAKGFGDEQPSTQFDIEAFFAPYGPTNSVRLRRHPEKLFKGSVFVEFDSPETQKAFLALDPKPKWKGKELQIKSKQEYCDEKVDDINSGKIQPNHQRGSRILYGKRGIGRDDRDWRERRDEDRKSGFKDDRRDRGHKGFGSSGRGRGRGRGRKDGRNRNEEQDRQRKEHEVPEIATSTPPAVKQDIDKSSHDDSKVETPTSPAQEVSKKRIPEDDDVEVNGNGNAKKVDTILPDQFMESSGPAAGPPSENANGASKKRAREDDGGLDVQGNAKKVDVKDS